MASETVRITGKAHQTLRELAQSTGEPMTVVMEQALEQFRRRLFLEGLARDFAALRANPKAWKEELEERALWDNALLDGLEED